MKDHTTNLTPGEFFSRLASLESHGPIVVNSDGVFIDGADGLWRVDVVRSTGDHDIHVAPDWTLCGLVEEGAPR